MKDNINFVLINICAANIHSKHKHYGHLNIVLKNSQNFKNILFSNCKIIKKRFNGQIFYLIMYTVPHHKSRFKSIRELKPEGYL